jgi:hypothetical protein
MIGTSKSIWGFDPRSVPGCQLWLDAADTTTLTLSASNVTAWTDKSPLATSFTLSNGSGGSTIRTTYAGLPVVQVSNSCFFNASYSYPLATRSIFFVMAEIVHSDWRGLLSFADTAGQSDYNTRNGYVITSTNTVGSNVQFSQNFGNGGFNFNYNASNGTKDVPFQLYEDVTSNTAVTLFISGSNVYSSNTSVAPLTSTGLTVGGRGGIPNTGALVIAEVLLYSNVLTTSQRQQVEGYLAHKWGLTGYYSPTIPLSIPGCQLWLDATDSSTFTLNGSNVSTWRDKSGIGNNATANTPIELNSTINGFPALKFTTAEYIGGNISITGNTLTVFSTFKVSSLPTFGRVISLGSLGGDDYNNTSSTCILNYGSAAMGPMRVSQYVSSATPLNTSVVHTVYFDGTNTYVYTNGGTASSMSSSGNFSVSRYNLGRSTNTGDTYSAFSGFLGEVIIYNTALTTTQRQTIEGYLARKWGLTSMYGALPSIHPFSSIRPHLRVFQPSDVDGCQLWLDGSDVSVLFSDVAGTSAITTNGQTIRCWKDKSGRGCNATQAGNAPIWNSSNYVNFTQSLGQFMNLPNGTLPFASGTNAYSIFAVANLNNTSGGLKTIIGNGSAGTNSFNALQIQAQSIANLWYNNDVAGGSLTANTFFIANIAFDGSTRYIYQTGTSVNTTASSGWAAPNTNNVIGVEPATGNWYYDGNIGEILVYNTALTTSQRQQVEGYLAHKWGLTTSIPSTHPFKSITPASLPFSPTTIPGCKIWFDSADQSSLTLSGTTVTAWKNKTGNSNASTGSGTVSINQASLNGRSSLRFPAGTNYLNVGAQTYTTSYRNQFFVVTLGAAGSLYWYLNCNDGICGQCYSWSNGNIELNRVGANGLVTNNPTNFFSSTSVVSICTSSGGNTGIWVNGVNQTLAVNSVGTGGFWSTGTTSTTITLGGESGRTMGTMDMYELLQYDGDLTTSQRQKIEGYLAHKWGLSESLPEGHPFKKFPA